MASTAIEAILTLNIAQFINNLKTVQNETDKTQKSISNDFTRAGIAITNAGKSLTAGLTVPLIAITKNIVSVGMAFDKEMSNVQALSGATGNDFDRLRNKAREMGSTTAYSATEAAQALSYMALAGYSTQEMVDSLSGVLYLAGASQLDLATTSDIVTDSITAFGLTAKDTDRFVDVMAATMSSSNTSTYQMGEAFKYVAPVAGALGFSVEETSVAIGLMADQGIKASQAGTTLRRALSNLVAPTDKQAQAMEELGIEVTNSDGSMKSLDEIMHILRSSMGDLTRAEQVQAASTIFGTQAYNGMLAVINASEESYNELTEAIQNSEGAAQELYEIQQDNLAGSFAIMRSALEEAAISLSDILTPAIRAVVDWITNLINKFNSLSQNQKTFVVIIGLVAAAIGPLLIVFGKLITTLTAIATGTTAVQLKIKALNAAWQESAARAALVSAAQGVYNTVIAVYTGQMTAAQAITKVYNATLGKLVAKITSSTLVVTAYNAIHGVLNSTMTIGQALHMLWDATLGKLAAKLGITEAATLAYTVIQGILNGTMSLGAAAAGLLAAAMNLIPFVAVATAIVAVVAGLVKLVSWLTRSSEEEERLTEETEELVEAQNQLVESLDSETAAHENNINAIRNQSQFTGQLRENIDDLINSTEESTRKTAQINAYVDQLNSSYEDLNLTYDATTNTLNMTQAEIDAVIASQENLNEVQLQQARYQEIALELLEIEAALNDVHEQRDEWNKAYDEGTVKSKTLGDQLDILQEQENELVLKHEELEGSLEEVNDRVVELGMTMEDSLGGATEQVIIFNEQQIESMDRVIDQYETTRDAATNMFSQISDSCEESIDDMIENLQKNQEAVAKWSENLAYLSALGVDDGLLKTLEDAGPESAAYVQAIVDGGEDKIMQLSDTFAAGTDVAVDSITTRLGEGQEETAQAAAELAEATGQSLKTAVENANFPESGAEVVQGYINGIDDNIGDAEDSATTLGDNTADALNDSLGIHSPSDVTTTSGEEFVNGFLKGTSNKTAEAISNMQTLAKQLTQAFEDAIDVTNSVNKTMTDVNRNFTTGYNQSIQITTQFGVRFKQATTQMWTQVYNVYKDYLTKINTQHKTQTNKINENNTNYLNKLNNNTKSQMNNLKSTAENILRSMSGTFYSIGQDMINGLGNGINSRSNWLNSQMRSVARSAANAAKAELKIHSPSVVMEEEVGEMIPEGIGKGIENRADVVPTAMNDSLAGAENILSSNTQDTSMITMFGDVLSSFADTMKNMLSGFSGDTTGLTTAFASDSQAIDTGIFSREENTAIYIDQITVRSDEDIKMLSRSLFSRDSNALRAQGRK